MMSQVLSTTHFMSLRGTLTLIQRTQPQATQVRVSIRPTFQQLLTILSAYRDIYYSIQRIAAMDFYCIFQQIYLMVDPQSKSILFWSFGHLGYQLTIKCQTISSMKLAHSPWGESLPLTFSSNTPESDDSGWNNFIDPESECQLTPDVSPGCGKLFVRSCDCNNEVDAMISSDETYASALAKTHSEDNVENSCKIEHGTFSSDNDTQDVGRDDSQSPSSEDDFLLIAAYAKH